MKVLTLESGPTAGDEFRGTVLCQTLRRGPTSKAIVLRKGQILDDQDIEILRRIEPQEVRVVRPEPGDLHEDDAGRRLAQAVAGPGVTLRGPIQSRFNLIATVRGIVEVDVDLLNALNAIPDMSAFTVLPFQPVSPGDIVAGAKVIPLVTRREYVATAERIAREHQPIIRVKPFQPRRVGVISKQRPDPPLRQRFEQILQRKLDWYGAPLGLIQYTEPDLGSVETGFRQVLADGADLIITAGSNSADPCDSLLVAVEALGGHVEVRGTPTHPGSFFWLAYLEDRAIFGMPSCGAYSDSTVVDLLLPRVLAGERLSRRQIAELGVGGLFERGMSARFPAYAIDESEHDVRANPAERTDGAGEKLQ